MAKVTIANEKVSFELPDGARLLDYAKEFSGMPFGCENGECGTCICLITKGSQNVERKNQREEMTLAKIGTYPSQRLACQLKIKRGEVEIEY